MRQALATALYYPVEQVLMTFQSRFGFNPWLLPATDEIIKSLPLKGMNRVQVICFDFAADFLETLEEIQVHNQEIFAHAGGSAFYYIPALNDDAAHLDMLRQLVKAELR